MTMITKGPTRAVQHDKRSTGELQCCKLASTYRGDDKVGDGGDSQEIVVMKKKSSSAFSQVVTELAVRLREGWRAEIQGSGPHYMER